MALIAWKDNFSVGNDEIDRQHKRLFELANRLHEGMLRGEGTTVLGPLLESVITYTKSHFAFEERLMADAQYPGLAAHHAQHEALAKQVTDIYDEYRRGGAGLTLKTLDFLKSWLQTHILDTDKSYSEHLRAHKWSKVAV